MSCLSFNEVFLSMLGALVALSFCWLALTLNLTSEEVTSMDEILTFILSYRVSTILDLH